jgi:hypothetical protein
MSHLATVPLDADGTSHDYLLMIVAAATGVTYTHQCGGFACLQNSMEGYLVQAGTPEDERRIYDWFQREFEGACMNASAWNPENIRILEGLISQVACWHTNITGHDSRHFLQLDQARMHECVEAWIPVHSPYGPGILVLNNSD